MAPTLHTCRWGLEVGGGLSAKAGGRRSWCSSRTTSRRSGTERTGFGGGGSRPDGSMARAVRLYIAIGSDRLLRQHHRRGASGTA
eukprot:2124453-Prorocentrum_lima.AAC.1